MNSDEYTSRTLYLPHHKYVNILGKEFILETHKKYFDTLSWQNVEKQRVIVFKTCWMVRPGCGCVYKYGNQSVKPVEFDDTMAQLTADISKIAGFPSDYFNSCNINMYMEESSYIEWHADDEALFRQSDCMRDVNIVSLSFGGPREILFNKKFGSERYEIKLCDGDLNYMGGRLQDHFRHHVPPWSAEKCGTFAPRVNLTWRAIRRITQTC